METIASIKRAPVYWEKEEDEKMNAQEEALCRTLNAAINISVVSRAL